MPHVITENLLLHPAVLKSEIENYSEKLIKYLKNKNAYLLEKL
jgi:hypothetical protein